MSLLLICILFNSYISIVFKLFEKFEIRVLQAIVLNYFVCTATASVIMGKSAVSAEVLTKDWLWVALIIGLNIVITFNLFAHTVQQFGVVIASIFQKMSLIAPTLIAIIIYGESSGIVKILGIILAIASIFVISSSGGTEQQTDKDNKKTNTKLIWLIPIGAFIGSCILDAGLFLVNQTGIANSNDIDFLAILFFCAGLFGLLFVIYDYVKNGVGYRKKDIIAAFALGIPNFFSIWFILKVLANGMDGSVVFPINNVGILVTTAILGALMFQEKFNKKKILGFVMAVAAIVLIATG